MTTAEIHDELGGPPYATHKGEPVDRDHAEQLARAYAKAHGIDADQLWSRAALELEHGDPDSLELKLEDAWMGSGLPADDPDLIGWQPLQPRWDTIAGALITLSAFGPVKAFERYVNSVWPRRRGPKPGGHHPAVIRRIHQQEREAQANGGQQSLTVKAGLADVRPETYVAVLRDVPLEK